MLTISISLIAVFIPLLLMGGIVGRLFREFAVTLSVAIGISMVISLTDYADDVRVSAAGSNVKRTEGSTGPPKRAFDWVVTAYAKALSVVLRHSFVTLLVLLATIALNVYLFVRVPKGFFPVQDTGRLNGNIQADQDTSFQQMDKISDASMRTFCTPTPPWTR